MTCGGKGHPQKDCPSKKFTPPSSNGNTPKAGPEKPQHQPQSTSSTTTKTVRIEEKPEVSEVNTQAGADGNAVGSDLREVLADVGRVLKSMTATTMKRLGISRKELSTPRCAVMRPNEETEEKDTLAGEDENILRQNMQGTILVQEEDNKVQPIVPLGALIEGLGYTLHWSPTKLRLSHPGKGTVRVKVNNHCPEVAACDALAMIRELEMKQVNALNSNVETLKARLEVVKLEEKRGWTELLGEYSSTGQRGSLLKVLMKCPFTKDLPAEVHNLMLESFDVSKGEQYLKSLPITRRPLLASKEWEINLQVEDGDDNPDPFSVIPKCGKIVLNVNVKKSKLWDLSRLSAAYQMLLWAATGRVSDVLGSPKTETWINSASERRTSATSPKRSQAEPHGLHSLPPLQQQHVDQETAAIAKQMLLWILASAHAGGPVGLMVELPADEERLREDDPCYVSNVAAGAVEGFQVRWRHARCLFQHGSPWTQRKKAYDCGDKLPPPLWTRWQLGLG